ncbi:MAG: hypothetical protein EOO37_02765 [Cytophagaceae bacterium]|nr:MAG: hypothetical protein EOO37_02765 [Cytophagaceae bacterium]
MSAYPSILSVAEYAKWTKNWENAEHHRGPFDFFMHKGKVQTGVIFHFDSLRYLFSTTGVVRIKIKFGLSEPIDGDNPRFHPILFGVDGNDTIITPYFVSSSFTHHHHYPKDEEGTGNLPQELMRLWKKSWRKNVSDGTVDQRMFFLTRHDGGFLKGYTYELKEIMSAVGALSGTSDIHIKFGLHKYYTVPTEQEPTLSFVHTFGLMFYAGIKVDDAASADLNILDKQADGVDGEVVDESGYYDFSAPCPFTC